ncbi:uncharacterized protein [Littorina saxatilis]|uniref:uncharacterized protein n=1 Tax=Littorina saxatilis TaxID=31220 RepID=UPI0038B63D5C
MVAAVSACAAVGIIIIICFLVLCIRKGGQASPTSRQSARGCSGRSLPQQPPSPRAQDEGPPQDHSSHKYEDMDNSHTDNAAGAFGVATGAQSASKGDNRLQAVRSAASQARFHRQHVSSGSSQPRSPVYDGDGYLLAEPPLFLRTKRHTSKPFFADSKV